MVQWHKRTLKEYYLLSSKEDFDKSISNILYSKLRVIKYNQNRSRLSSLGFVKNDNVCYNT